MGHIFFNIKQNIAAKACFLRANELKPNDYTILKNLGLAYQVQKDYVLALKFLKQAKSINNSVDVNNIIGSVFYLLKDLESSKRYFQDSVEIESNNSDAYLGLAEIYQTLSQKEQAIESCKKAISCNKNNYHAYYQLSKLKKFDRLKDSVLFEQIESLLLKKDMESEDFVRLYFTLGKMCNDFEDYDKAFEYYNKANIQKQKYAIYNSHQVDRIVKNSKTVFAINNSMILSKRKSKSSVSIFVVGMPRSGTTLTEQVLNSHSKVTGLGESNNVGSTIQLAENNKQITYPELINGLNENEKDLLVKHYFDQIKHFKTDFVVDKMPSNFFYIGLIYLLFQNSIVINCRRHPLDICLSLYQTYFHDLNMNFSYSIESIVHYYKAYNDIMRYWKGLFPNKIYDCYYEKLVLNQENTSRDLIKHCNLEWEDSCLNFHNSDSAVFTASSSQVREKLYTNSINCWKKYENQLEKAKELLADEIAEYETELNKLLN